MYLRWARRLAQVEGIILLFGVFMMIFPGGMLDRFGLVAGAAAMGILSLTLGWQVGRGSIPAATILLGLSVSRGVVTLVPGGPDWWTTFPLITLLELIIFGQGVRGAIALARHNSSPTPATSVVVPSAITIELRVPELRPIIPAAARSFVVDLVVVLAVGALSILAMRTSVPGGEGLMGVGEMLIVLAGVFNFVVAVVLLVSANAARRGKRWGGRVRLPIYWLLAAEVLIWIRLVI